jgi:membrane protease YdiL (CAAX protease family)
MKNNSIANRIKSPLTLMVIWGLILEFPIRYWLSPDPWIHSSEHWYFGQPTRILIELAFVFLALIPFFFLKELKNLLRTNWSNNDRLVLILGVLGSVLFFGLQQWEDIKLIQQENLLKYVPLWFVTGIAVGFGQELTFRGLIYTGLLKKIGMKWAVVLSTFCFLLGSIHSIRLYAYLMNDYIMETILLVGIFILAGLFFVWVRIKTNNILIPSIIHGIGNAITWATFVVVKLYT